MVYRRLVGSTKATKNIGRGFEARYRNNFTYFPTNFESEIMVININIITLSNQQSVIKIFQQFEVRKSNSVGWKNFDYEPKGAVG